MVVMVIHKLLVMSRVLGRRPTMANRCRGRVSKLTRVLSKVEMMLLLATGVRIVVLMPKVKSVRCDEGYRA
jgi:hypothetical protein